MISPLKRFSFNLRQHLNATCSHHVGVARHFATSCVSGFSQNALSKAVDSVGARLGCSRRRFVKEERAAVSIEAAIMLPALIFLFVAGYQYFESYRKETLITKASYAIADVLSRQLSAFGPGYVEGLEQVFETMTLTEGRSWIRVTEIVRTDDGLEIADEGNGNQTWATDNQPVMTPARLQAIEAKIPRMQLNERVTLVETFTLDIPAFRVGISPRIISTFSPTRQRYARLPMVVEPAPDLTQPTAFGNECVVETSPEGIISAVGCGTYEGPLTTQAAAPDVIDTGFDDGTTSGGDDDDDDDDDDD